MRKSTKSYLADVNLWLALLYDRHIHHSAAQTWLQTLDGGQVLFCRFSQMGLLRLLTNEAVMRKDVRTQRSAWVAYDRALTDPRVAFADEPPRLEIGFRKFTASQKTSTKVWADAYLLAFAAAANLMLATFDKALETYPGVEIVPPHERRLN